jgi:hypothetical protein
MLARIQYLEAQLSATQKAYEGLRQYVASRPWDRDALGNQVREPDQLEEAFGFAHLTERITSIEPAIEQAQDQGKEKGKGKAQESEALAAALQEHLHLDDPSLPESVAGDDGRLFHILPKIIATQLKSALAGDEILDGWLLKPASAPSTPAPALAPLPAPSPLALMALDAGLEAELVLVTEMAVDEITSESPLATAMDPAPLPAPSPPPPASAIEPASAAGEALVDYPDSDSESMVAEPTKEENHATADIAGEAMDGIEASSQLA